MTERGCISHRAEVSSMSETTGATRLPEGSTPAAAERRQDAAMGARTVPDSRRRENRSQPSPTNFSQALLSSRALCAGAVATSMASH